MAKPVTESVQDRLKALMKEREIAIDWLHYVAPKYRRDAEVMKDLYDLAFVYGIDLDRLLMKHDEWAIAHIADHRHEQAEMGLNFKEEEVIA